MNRLSSSNRPQSAGFTLIEILIGLTLLSLIMLMLFSGLHGAGKSWSRGEDKINRTDELRLTSQFIRQRLSQVVPIVWINKNERRLAFKGTPDALYFIAPLPAHRGGGGLYQLAIKLNREEAQQYLVLVYRLALPDQQNFDFSSPGNDESAVLAGRINRVEFAYFGNTAPDEEPQWQDRWDSTELLPQMVRIIFSPADLQTGWPEILVRIHPQAVNGQPQFFQFAGHDQDAAE
jgi:general secretion pathway protein J